MSEEMITEQVAEMTEIIGVSFREAGKIYYFAPEKYKFNAGDRVIVDTARGLEMGTVKVANKKLTAARA